MNGPETRRSLLLRLRDPNHQEAWAEFVSIYRPIVYRMARQHGFQDSDAEDLCQQVMTAVSTSIDRFRSDPKQGSFRGWLHRITKNLIINVVTRDKSVRGSGDSEMHRLLAQQADLSLEASTCFDIEHRRVLFRRAADRVKSEVSEESWTAFWQSYVEGRPIAEVAGALNKKQGTIRVARCRVFARIKKLIEQQEQEYEIGSQP